MMHVVTHRKHLSPLNWKSPLWYVHHGAIVLLVKVNLVVPGEPGSQDSVRKRLQAQEIAPHDNVGNISTLDSRLQPLGFAEYEITVC